MMNPQHIQVNLEFNKENFDKLQEQNTVLKEALESVINGCVHPEVAFRAVMVDLAPIRKALKKNKDFFGS